MKKFRFALPFAITFFDLWIKSYFRNKINWIKYSKWIPFLSLHPVKNKGILLNLFENIKYQPYLKHCISAILLIIIYEWFKLKNKNEQTAWSFIIGGGIGNLIDRYLNNYVLDYLNINFLSITCNFADLSVCIGLLYLLYLSKPIWKNDNKIK